MGLILSHFLVLFLSLSLTLFVRVRRELFWLPLVFVESCFGGNCRVEVVAEGGNTEKKIS